MYTILHTESSSGWGGQENRIIRESIGLRQRGARVLILCQPGSVLSARASLEGFEVRTCRMRKNYDIPAVRFILRLVRAEGVDIVSTHSGRDSFLAGLAGRVSRSRPVVVRTRHLALPITSRISYSLLPHAVITTSEYVRKYLMTEGVPGGNVVAVPTGIDPGEFDPEAVTGSLKEELGIDPDAPLVSVVAILRRKKGHHVLLDAAPEILRTIPRTVFAFAGEGPQYENIRRKIESMGLTRNVFMLGFRNDVPNILKSSDLFVLPTLQESLAQSLLQAMAMEKPVVGTNVGGVKEAITDGVNGCLVRADDPAGLAAAVVSVLSDRQRAKEMGRQGRAVVLRDYTLERMSDRMHSLYLSLLQRRRH